VLCVNPVLVVCLQPLAITAARRFGGTALLVATGVFGAAGALCFAFARSAVGFGAGMAVITLGEVASSPVAPAVVAELSPPGRLGRYQGVYTMAIALAACVSPIAGTTLLASAGPGALWGGCAVIGAAVALGHWAAAGPRKRRLASLAGRVERGGMTAAMKS
jgi:MFS family permease